MKRSITFIVAICLIATFIPMSVGAETGKSYVSLGDSITAGYGLESVNDAFPTLLAAELGNDYTLSNKAVSGDTTTDLLAHLKKADYKQAVAAADVVTVTIGGNDLLAFLYKFLSEKLGMNLAQVTAALESGDYTVVVKAANAIVDGSFAPSAEDQAAIAANHTEIVKQIKELNPDVTLVIATQYNPYEKLAAQVSSLPSFMLQGDIKTLADAIVKLSETVESTIIPFNEGVKDRAAAQSYIVADAYTTFKSTSENLSNAAFTMSPFAIGLDFHPNKAGHAAIAACIKNALSPSASCDHSASTVKPSCDGSALCSVCGKAMAPIDHTPAVLPAVPATCTETGLTEGSGCSVCKAIITAQEVVPAKGHSGGSATCKDPAKCEICGAAYGEPDTDHFKYMAEEVFFDDNEHWRACLCGQKFLVTEHNLNDSGACIGCNYKKAANTTTAGTTDSTEPKVTTTVATDQPESKSCAGSLGAIASVAVAVCAILGTALVKKH